MKRFPKLFCITGFLYLVFLLQSLPTETYNSSLSCSLIFFTQLEFKRSDDRISNGLVDSFHRQLKATITFNFCAVTPCNTSVPFDFCPADTVFGTPLELPGQFSYASTDVIDPSMRSSHLNSHTGTIGAQPTRSSSRPKDLTTYTRFCSLRYWVTPVDPVYSDPFRVSFRHEERFITDTAGHTVTESIERLKVTLLDLNYRTGDSVTKLPVYIPDTVTSFDDDNRSISETFDPLRIATTTTTTTTRFGRNIFKRVHFVRNRIDSSLYMHTVGVLQGGGIVRRALRSTSPVSHSA